jgi:putative oxidoreductase
MKDFGLLILRLTVGGLLAGHGGQKLFGWFRGPGLQKAGGWMESLGLRPGQRWAAAAGMGEFTGGLLTALGFLSPVGPISMFGPMIVAWGKVHKDKPIWASEGGAELPMTNIAVAAALALTGPGKYSLDSMLGMRPGPFVTALAAAAVAAGTAMVFTQPEPEQERAESADQSEPAQQSSETRQPQAVGVST